MGSFTPPQGFVEAKAPQLFKFNTVGDELYGVFLNAKPFKMKDTETGEIKDVLEVYFRTQNNEVVKFRPSYDVREKLNKGMIGKGVLIRYMRDEASKGREGNAYKEFGVWVNGRTAQGGDESFVATDDDIPF